jgi:hypothetical protein
MTRLLCEVGKLARASRLVRAKKYCHTDSIATVRRAALAAPVDGRAVDASRHAPWRRARFSSRRPFPEARTIVAFVRSLRQNA